MQTEALPHTHVPCPHCGRPTAPGKYCASCGTHAAAREDAPPAPPQNGASHAAAEPPRGRSWLPAAIVAAIAVAAFAATAVVLIVVGGEPSSAEVAPASAQGESVDAVRLSATNLYAPLESGGLTAQLPAGWRRTAAKVAGVGGVTATSAQDRGAAVTVGVLDDADGTLAEVAERVRDERDALPRYEERSFRAQSLPGDRRAWKLRYARGDRATVEYLIPACDRVLLVSGTADERAFRNLENRFGVVARSAQVVC